MRIVLSSLLSAALSVFVGSVFAATWPTYKNPTGDLSAGEGWNTGVVPNSADNACIDQRGPYTASSDLHFKKFYTYANYSEIDFTGTPDRKVTLYDTNLVNFEGNGKTLVLRDGIWGLEAQRDMNVFSSSSGKKLILTNSCQVVNANTFIINSQSGTTYPHDNELVISDNSSVTSKYARLGSSYCYNNKLTVLSGGKFHVSGWFYVDNQSEGNGSGNTITVDGIGSRISQNSSDGFLVSNKGSNNKLIVRNGGEVFSKKLGVGNSSTAVDNVARFESGASLFATNLAMKGSGNTVSADSSTVCAGNVDIRGVGNTFTVTNTPLTCSSVSLAFEPSDAGNRFIVSGSSSVMSFSLADLDVFGKLGYGNLFALEDGASWTIDNGIYLRFMQESSNNVFRIAGGAALTNRWSGLTIGFLNPTNCTGNRLEILGGSLSVSNLLVEGVCNGIIVSNGTLRTMDVSHGIALGYRYASTSPYYTTNCFLSVQGTEPFIDLTGGNLRVVNGSRLHFEIPEGGYPQGHIPVAAGYFTFDPSAKIEIDCTGFVNKTGGKVKLMSIRNSISVIGKSNHEDNHEEIARTIVDSCTGLPSGCSLVVEKKEIYLKTPSRKGMKIFVK
jgi:hypothetical protein